MIYPMQIAHLHLQQSPRQPGGGREEEASSLTLGVKIPLGRAGVDSLSVVIKNLPPLPSAPECSSITTSIPDNRFSQRRVLSMGLRGLDGTK